MCRARGLPRRACQARDSRAGHTLTLTDRVLLTDFQPQPPRRLDGRLDSTRILARTVRLDSASVSERRALTDRVLPTDFSSLARSRGLLSRRPSAERREVRWKDPVWALDLATGWVARRLGVPPRGATTPARAHPIGGSEGLAPSRVRRRLGIPPSSPAHEAGQRTRRGSVPMRGYGLRALARARSRSPGRRRTPSEARVATESPQGNTERPGGRRRRPLGAHRWKIGR